MWRSSVERMYCVFPRCWKTGRDFNDMPQSDRQYLSCYFGYSPHLHVLMTISNTNYGFTLLKLPNNVNSADGISAACSLFFPDHSGQGNREGHFPDNMWILNQRSWRCVSCCIRFISTCIDFVFLLPWPGLLCERLPGKNKGKIKIR